jgi:DNA-binding MarR family transcriptional regulator
VISSCTCRIENKAASKNGHDPKRRLAPGAFCVAAQSSIWCARQDGRFGPDARRASASSPHRSFSLISERKYVNMADVNLKPDENAERASVAGSKTRVAAPLSAEERPEIAFIELLFFAYRDFISDPDAALLSYGFGRAHHRVIHFVNRHPGIRVADLLDILKITKQSLGRVLKQLVDTGFIEQLQGPQDRRQRLLYPTEAGRALALRLLGLQEHRIGAALEALSPSERLVAQRFLKSIVNPGERETVARLIGR